MRRCWFVASLVAAAAAQLTQEQCERFDNTALSPQQGEKFCGCNDVGGVMVYTAPAALCSIAVADRDGSDAEFSIQPQTELVGDVFLEVLVAGAQRGCFVKCALTEGCVGATAELLPSTDTRCTLLLNVTGQSTNAAATAATVTRSGTITVAVDDRVALCPADRPVVDSDRLMCLPSPTTCGAADTGLQHRSPASGSLRVRMGATVRGYSPVQDHQTGGARPSEWYYTDLFRDNAVGLLKVNETRPHLVPARYQVDESTALPPRSFAADVCTSSPNLAYSRIKCAVAANSSNVIEENQKSEPCECEQAAASVAGAVAWDFDAVLSVCRLFNTSCTRDETATECHTDFDRCSASLTATQWNVTLIHITNQPATPQTMGGGDFYQLGDVLFLEPDVTKVLEESPRFVVDENMFIEHYDQVSCADMDCSLRVDVTQCRCKCAEPVACAYTMCFDHDSAGVPERRGSRDGRCELLAGVYDSATGGEQLNITAPADTGDMQVEFDTGDTAPTAAVCRYGAIRFDGGRIDYDPHFGNRIIVTAPHRSASWSKRIPAPPPPPTGPAVPPPPPTGPKHSVRTKIGIGVASAIAAIVLLGVGIRLGERGRKRAYDAAWISVRESLLPPTASK